MSVQARTHVYGISTVVGHDEIAAPAGAGLTPVPALQPTFGADSGYLQVKAQAWPIRSGGCSSE